MDEKVRAAEKARLEKVLSMVQAVETDSDESSCMHSSLDTDEEPDWLELNIPDKLDPELRNAIFKLRDYACVIKKRMLVMRKCTD